MPNEEGRNGLRSPASENAAAADARGDAFGFRHSAFGIHVALLLVLSTVSAQRQDLGVIHFPTSTKSSKAQRHFERGVAWLHSFGYEEAIDEFQAAQLLDSGFAMAYWGEAMAHSQPIWFTENVAAARRVLTLFGMARAYTPREQGYLDAVRILFGTGDRSARQAAYAAAMGKLAARYPDDLEAACFYALALLATVPRGGYDLDVRERAGAIASAVLRKSPRHPGAAHTVIHAYDDREHAHRALDAARTYARIAPAASHALHMPAHIFLQLGYWDDAVASDEASFAASDARVRRRKLPITQRDYHSLSWLAYEYLQRGQFAKARATWSPVEEAIKIAEASGSRLGHSPSEEHAHARAAPVDAQGGPDSVALKNDLATMRAFHVIETGRWDLMKGTSGFNNVDELFALGMSAARLKDVDRAEAARQLFEKFAKTEKDPSRQKLVAIMEMQMLALVHRARGRKADAVQAAARAAAIERTLSRPVGRPHPIKPSHELHGELLIEAGRPSDAIGEFEHALWRAANRARSLIGLARAQAAAGDRAAARKTYARLLETWKQADSDVPELKEALAFRRD
jgi:tetratricopeptide (TPR) repeat protein